MAVVADSVQDRLRDEQVLAVIRAGSAAEAVQAGRALAEGGVRALEVAFTTPDAATAIGELAADPELFVGAGTVLSGAQAHAAIDAGAAFLVSPSLVPDALSVAREAGVLALPGALTPTEVVAAAEQAEVVKLFPASLGGVSYLKALLAPLPELRIVPTGGVSATNASEWLAAGAFAVGAGGDLCPPALIAEGRFDELTRRARGYREALDTGKETR
jgi:2-dehydro-3-deoxyphosphogluconate aldolase/(4S)-4-hydroxy-2-oxoglutarate aldolase